MDDSRPFAYRLRAFRRNASRTCFLLIVLTIYGCSSPEPPRPPSSLAADFSELAKSVAALRRLPLKRDIAIESLSTSKNEIEPKGPRVDDYQGLPALQVERAYKSIGLLPNDTDLAKALADYRRLEDLIRYDTAKGTVALTRDAAKLGAPFEKANPRTAREAPAVIGIVKALQQQHFNWSATANSIFLEDRLLAFRALATTDAILTVIARAEGKDSIKLSASDIDIAHRLAAAIDKLSAPLPDFLRRKLSFPYREGISFVYWAFAAKGWEGVNALYANPPLTTAQVLHPEIYFVRRVEPLVFFPAGLIRGAGESSVIEQSFGEYLIRALLESQHSSKYAADTAAPWRGDQLFHFQAGGDPVTAWFSAWESEKRAREFHRAYQAVVERRQRLRFTPASDNDDDALIADTRDRGAYLLQVKGPVVLLLNVISAGRLQKLAEETWKDLEIEPESKVIPFESAKPANQLSLRSR